MAEYLINGFDYILIGWGSLLSAFVVVAAQVLAAEKVKDPPTWLIGTVLVSTTVTGLFTLGFVAAELTRLLGDS